MLTRTICIISVIPPLASWWSIWTPIVINLSGLCLCLPKTVLRLPNGKMRREGTLLTT